MKTRYGHTSWDIYPPADLPTGSLLPIARGANGHNARLIAAAPELLAALRSIEAKADYGKDNPRRQTDILFDILELAQVAIEKATEETYDNRHERQAARAAIAKATGGAA
jgi:hypothetical protein